MINSQSPESLFQLLDSLIEVGKFLDSPINEALLFDNKILIVSPMVLHFEALFL